LLCPSSSHSCHIPFYSSPSSIVPLPQLASSDCPVYSLVAFALMHSFSCRVCSHAFLLLSRLLSCIPSLVAFALMHSFYCRVCSHAFLLLSRLLSCIPSIVAFALLHSFSRRSNARSGCRAPMPSLAVALLCPVWLSRSYAQSRRRLLTPKEQAELSNKQR
jgi:hypothetical protein